MIDRTSHIRTKRRTPAGKGAAYGTVIHQIFDDAINMRLPDDPTPYVAHLLQETGADTGFLPHALDALQHFRNSEIWTENTGIGNRLYRSPLCRIASGKQRQRNYSRRHRPGLSPARRMENRRLQTNAVKTTKMYGHCVNKQLTR